MTVVLRVTRVLTYPVKSLAGNDVESAVVEPWGLAGDRRWALVDERGTNITAREINQLLGLRAELTEASSIRIIDRNGESITVATPIDAATTPVDFLSLPQATAAAATAGEWISARAGRPLRLVWQQDPTQRTITEKHGGNPGDSVTLADAAPLLLVTESSQRQLDEWIGSETPPLDILRFRPNLIVNGEAAFDEDNWNTVRVGEVTFRKTELCGRCVMPTIDRTTLVRGKEPIRTLAQHRRWDGLTWFGIRVAPVGVSSAGTHTVSVGDRVEVLSLSGLTSIEQT